MQQTLKPAPGVARAQIVAAELLDQLDVAVHETPAAPHMCFRGEGLPPLRRDVESRGGRRNRDACAWHASIKKTAGRPRGSIASGLVAGNMRERQGRRAGLADASRELPLGC